MNTMVKRFLIAVMAIGFTGSAFASADRSAQMMHERNVDVGVLADRVEACLRRDRTGTSCRPQGSNATVADFVTSVQGHHSKLFTELKVAELPGFLRSLERRVLPKDLSMCLSGMNGSKVVATCKQERLPHPGEYGWYKGDTLVLAGDCLNAVVPAYAVPLAATEVDGTAWKPYPAEAAPSDRGGSDADSPQCPVDGTRLTTVFVYAEEALRTSCAEKYVIDRSRYTSGTGRVGGYESTGNENVFSLKCGAEMRRLKMRFSTTPHPVQLSIVKGDQAIPLFKGVVTGNVLAAADANSSRILIEDGSAVEVPDEIKSGFLVWTFTSGGMASPTNTGLGIDVQRLRGAKDCNVPRLIGHAIEGGNRQVAAATTYDDD